MYLQVSKNQEMVAASSNNPYIRTTFRPVKLVGGTTVFSGVKSGVRFFSPGKEPSVGDLFEGAIKEFATTDYQIDGRTVNTISVVAMADENPTELANAILERNKACVIINGKPTVELAKLAGQPEAVEVED